MAELKVVQFEKRQPLEMREYRNAGAEPPTEKGFYFARQKGFSRIEPVEVVIARLPGCKPVAKVYMCGIVSPRPAEMFQFFGRVPRVEEG